MRIISGNLRGKKILQPKDKYTRPLKDLTKESIFNIIEHSNLFNVKIEKSNILDLFSGVGSFGLECLSRGSLSVTFVENYSNTLDLLKKNILNNNFRKKSKIIEKNIFKDKTLENIKEKFNIIFMDPPYKERKFPELVEKIIDLNLLEKNGIFIIHRHKKNEEKYTKKFDILIKKNYGISKIIFGNKKLY
tara:strand:+ start:27 stop:596 length:570 start_codon:yes stop_codon:yes gene_type:complete